ncbi:hypothetical protein ACOMHN_002587 [Nucella lapillus]
MSSPVARPSSSTTPNGHAFSKIGVPCPATPTRYTAPVHIDVGGVIYTSSLETLTRIRQLQATVSGADRALRKIGGESTVKSCRPLAALRHCVATGQSRHPWDAEVVQIGKGTEC